MATSLLSRRATAMARLDQSRFSFREAVLIGLAIARALLALAGTSAGHRWHSEATAAQQIDDSIAEVWDRINLLGGLVLLAAALVGLLVSSIARDLHAKIDAPGLDQVPSRNPA